MIELLTARMPLIIRFALPAIILVIGSSCARIKYPKTVHFSVKDAPESLVDERTRYKVIYEDNVIASDTSNEFGYFKINKKELAQEIPGRRLHLSKLKVCVIQGVGEEEKEYCISLNNYLHYYDVYVKQQNREVAMNDRVADMHYHISMRSHNKFAYDFTNPLSRVRVPENINWIKDFKKLEVFHKGKWKKAKLKSDTKAQKEKLKILLEGKQVQAKHGANNLKHYSEATNPHLLEGNVYLAFNAISPFENSISKDGLKRGISSAFKSGAPIDWLRLMGGKKGFISHWQNFMAEYEMITSQKKDIHGFNWDYLSVGENLADRTDIPMVVNVVEGGHILQDRFFPHFIDYDIGIPRTEEKLRLYGDIQTKIENATHLEDSIINYSTKTAAKIDGEENPFEVERIKNEFVDNVLRYELIRNIDSLKNCTDIHMMAISHLSYNGMTGHSLALDVSKKPWTEALVSQVVKRAYRIKSSSDQNYRKSYNGLFYTVPGINMFGETVIDRLLSEDIRRINIDLKHSDVQTRREVLNRYKSDPNLKPICSHCAVTGITIDFNSPIVDEYNLYSSSLARKFYPFGINLYDEEVIEICNQQGIIGIPLEERVLGGYVDNRLEWTKKIKKDSIKTLKNTIRKKRWKYTEHGFNYLLDHDDDIIKQLVKHYDDFVYKGTVQVKKKGKYTKKFKKLLFDEYRSAEPFLQNIFHIVDLDFRSNKIGGLEEWNNICIGSDLDGLIDPINICPTSSHYPEFKTKLKYIIPVFLHLRNTLEIENKVYGEAYRTYSDYFSGGFTVEDALDHVFYTNLFNYTKSNF